VAVRRGEGGQVGDIKFALRVVVFQKRNVFAQNRGIHAECPRIAQGDFFLRVVGVLFLHDAAQSAVIIKDKAAKGGRV